MFTGRAGWEGDLAGYWGIGGGVSQGSWWGLAMGRGPGSLAKLGVGCLGMAVGWWPMIPPNHLFSVQVLARVLWCPEPVWSWAGARRGA